DGSAIKLMEAPLLARVPPSFAIPETTATLFTCPSGFDDTTITPHDGTVAVQINELQIGLDDGAIIVDAVASFQAQAQIDMTLCAMRDASGRGTASGASLHIAARLTPTLDACVVSFDFADLTVDVDPDTLEATLDDCGLYTDVWSVAYGTFRDYAVGLAID